MEVEVIELEGEVQKSENRSYYDNEDISYFYENELKRLLSGTKKIWRLVYLIAFETAARVGEIRKIQFNDIDFDRNKVKIETSKQRGANRFRILTISDTLKAAILQHRLKYSLKDTDYVISKKVGGNPIFQQSMDRRLKKDCESMDIPREKAHMHTFRHTRAIQLLESGMDIVKVKKILGHRNIQNTLIYLKYSDKDVERGIKKANLEIGLN